MKDKFKAYISKFLIPYFSITSRILKNYIAGKERIAKEGYLNSLVLKFLKYKMIKKWGCHISYKCKIGKNIKFPHPLGIVIGDGVVIGDNVKIWQNVTIGSDGRKEGIFNYPIIGDNVKIYAGAVIIGGISVGDGAIIGANAVVLQNVPPNSIAVGIPAKIIQKFNNEIKNIDEN